jgi:hypothetical protein
MRLTSPSKWQRLYQCYQGDSEASIEHSENAELLPKEGDFTLFRFYSPLIPTRERNIYAMQVLFNTIFVDGSISRRMWFLKINYFTIKRGKVVSQQRSHDKVIIRTY